MGYPSGGDFFGSGFVQGLGQSLQALPRLLAARDEREQQKEELALKKAILDKQDKLLQVKLQQLGKNPAQVIGEILGQLNGSGQGIAGPSPAPSSPLRESLVGGPPDASQQPPVDVSAQAPAVPQPQGAEPQRSQYDVQGVNYDATTGSTSIRIGKRQFTSEMKPMKLENGMIQFVNTIKDENGNVVKMAPVEHYTPVPPDAVLQARAAAKSYGAPDGALDSIAGSLLAAQNIPDAETRTAQLQAIQQQARQLGQIAQATPGAANAEYDIAAPDIAESVKRGQQAAAQGAGLKTSAEAKARADVEQATAGPVAEAKARGTAAAQLKPAQTLVSKLSDLIDGIKLPTSGSERISEAPRLYGESFKQSNQNIVLYETLKNGFLATIARAAGERGVLTDQDTARAASLFPVVVPGIGRLPDTKETAKNKMNQIRTLLEDFVRRDPALAGELGASGGSPNAAPKWKLDRIVP